MQIETTNYPVKITLSHPLINSTLRQTWNTYVTLLSVILYQYPLMRRQRTITYEADWVLLIICLGRRYSAINRWMSSLFLSVNNSYCLQTWIERSVQSKQLDWDNIACFFSCELCVFYWFIFMIMSILHVSLLVLSLCAYFAQTVIIFSYFLKQYWSTL